MSTSQPDSTRPYDPQHLERRGDVDPVHFFALDLRVGRIVHLEPFDAARNPAFKLVVDFGPVVGKLRTSAQVANYTPDELMGRLVVGAINIGSKRIAGFVSEFLLLGGLEADGTVRLLGVDPVLPPGSVIA